MSFFRRVKFTARDDEELARFIALIMPYEGAGGRSGMNIYKRLVECVRPFPTYIYTMPNLLISQGHRATRSVQVGLSPHLSELARPIL